MKEFIALTLKERLFAIIFLSGFLFKYNYLMFRIFYVPSITGIILRNLVFILLFYFFLLPRISRKKGSLLIIIISVSFTAIFMANYWYNNYYGNFLSYSSIIMGQGVGRFSIFEVLIRQILQPQDLLFFFDLVLLIFLFNLKSDTVKGFSQKKFMKSRGVIKRFAFLIIFLLITGQIFVTGALLGNHNPVELYHRSSAKFVNVYGFLPLYMAEAYYDLFITEFTEAEAEMVNFPGQGELFVENNLAEGTNIIVIQVESLDKKLIDYHYQGTELTPYINYLNDNSLSFPNFYAQHINGSFDADFSLLTSLYPVNRNYVYRNNDLTKFDSLVRVLNNKGYQTLAFHGNDKQFFHRHQAFAEFGFDRFYGRDDFNEDELVMEVEKETLGINDYDFFKQSVEFLEEVEQPFFAHFITVTSHTPFDFYPPDEKREEFEEIENELVQDFFQSIAFLDKSMEMFFTELEKRDLREDTLFIIFSDHESDIDEEEYYSGQGFIMERNVKKPQHIPLMIKHPDIETGERKITGSITDLALTIIDLLGIEEIPAEFMGLSLFSELQNRPLIFIHETPQVLYRNNLFVLEKNEVSRIGYLPESKEEKPTIEQEKLNVIENKIVAMRNLILSRRRKNN